MITDNTTGSVPRAPQSHPRVALSQGAAPPAQDCPRRDGRRLREQTFHPGVPSPLTPASQAQITQMWRDGGAENVPQVKENHHVNKRRPSNA